MNLPGAIPDPDPTQREDEPTRADEEHTLPDAVPALLGDELGLEPRDEPHDATDFDDTLPYDEGEVAGLRADDARANADPLDVFGPAGLHQAGLHQAGLHHATGAALGAAREAADAARAALQTAEHSLRLAESEAKATARATKPRRRLASLAEDLNKLPNQLTMLRLLLCVLFFGVMVYCSTTLVLPVDSVGELHWTRLRGDTFTYHASLQDASGGLTLLLNGAFVVFLLAALSDVADGYIARAYGLESDFGRIADPFVDKIMILGAYTLLIPLTVHVKGWMVVMILSRELLVSGIRSFAESRGIAFPASGWGKAKMFSQSAAVGAALLYVGHPSSTFLKWGFLILLYTSLVATAVSGLKYGSRAKRLLFRAD